MASSVFVLENIAKKFAGKAAVDDLSFAVQAGAITGFLGPNGAGKTTSLRIGLGILDADSGQARLFGARPSYTLLDRVGFLPEERGLYRKMKVLAAIVFFGRLKGLSARDARARGMALLERFDLAHVASHKIKTLSKGMAQKVQIIAAIVHAPELVILDEPFSGLDPVNQRSLEAFIKALAEGGTTVLFSTHVMEHAERLCDRIVLMSEGRKIFDGNVDEALQTLPRTVQVRTRPDADLPAALGALAQDVREDGLDARGQKRWQVTLAPGHDVQEVLRACVQKDVGMSAFEPKKRRLHEVFMFLVDRDTARGKG